MDSDDIFRHLRRDWPPGGWPEAIPAAPLTRESFDAMLGELRARAILGDAVHAKVEELRAAMHAEVEAYARELLRVVELDRLGLELRAGYGMRLTVDGRPALDVWIDWPDAITRDYTLRPMAKRHALTIKHGPGEETTIGTREVWSLFGGLD